MFYRLIAASVIALTVAACEEKAPQTHTLTGTVSYRERMALPPDAEVEVALVDVSLADAPSVTIAETRFQPQTSVPIAFELTYDPSKIDDRHTYALQARITDHGRLMFITTTQYRVLQGGQNMTDLMLERTN